MSSRPPRLLTRNRLIGCILINQLATPGLGSLLARRWIAGAGQLMLALTGFGLVVTWMLRLFYGMILTRMDRPAPPSPPDWLWNRGWIFFGAAWLWALVTSISLLRQAKAAGDAPPVSGPG